METKYTVTLKQLDGDFCVDFNYKEYDEATEKFKTLCADKGSFMALMNMNIYEITLQIFIGDDLHRTKKVIIQGFEY